MSMNLYELVRNRKNHLNNQLVKIYCFQALRALDQMHSKGVFHRDIKVGAAAALLYAASEQCCCCCCQLNLHAHIVAAREYPHREQL